jgi:thiamine kinase-like enzyme/FMN phosphatase YigB (HAD superfamily)
MVIGVDFDNTLVSYDDLLDRLARERGFLTGNATRGKKSIRDLIRQLPNGEIEWQKLQGVMYGPRLDEAQLIPGAREFFRACQQRGIRAVIISHKTEYAGYDDTHTNLRQAALAWMEKNGVFSHDGFGLRREDVYFAATRAEKINAIQQLGCTLFVDDLEETLLDPTFPTNVEKILFAPHGHSALPGVRVFHSCDEIREHVFQETATAFSRLLERPVTTLEWIGGGGNNRIYKLDAAHVGKAYFEQRRLDVEFAALQFVWRHGVRCVPQPVAADPVAKIAVYEFVEGRKPTVNESDIDAAIEFLVTLKKLATEPDAAGLPAAAEACFSVAAIIANLQQRLQRLERVPALQEFLDHEFRPLLTTLALERQSQEGFAVELPGPERTLSPSDFGFHNALRRPDGQLVFLDFEYFGWDDPAKMLVDFLLHPGMDLTEDLKQRFAVGMYRRFDANKNLVKRAAAVYPLFGLKWCMIILNEFLQGDLQRRGFAGGGNLDRVTAQARQLEKARRMLEKVKRGHEYFPYGI